MDVVQQSIDPTGVDSDKQIEQKVILLFYIDSMDGPVTNAQITQFALEEDYMNYYFVQKYLEDIGRVGYLETALDDTGQVKYSVTTEGLTALDVCVMSIPLSTRTRIARYAMEHRAEGGKDFDSSAHIFEEYNGEFTVKCDVSEDENELMLVKVSVVNKEQAVIISNNWKHNVNALYGKILNLLLGKHEESQDDAPTDTD